MRQESVRFEVETNADGLDPRQTTWSGTLHLATTGFIGATLDAEVTMRHQSRFGPRSYHAVEFNQRRETYVEHNQLTLPAGKKYVKIDYKAQVSWMWEVDRQISMDSNTYHPSGLFADLDRDTLRLVDATNDRYVLTAGRAVESNPATANDAPVTLTVWVDNDRVTRAEQASHGEDGHPHRKTTVLSDWGSAPPVHRPSPQIVANPAEVTWSPR
jgi:hypothetical protein